MGAALPSLLTLPALCYAFPRRTEGEALTLCDLTDYRARGGDGIRELHPLVVARVLVGGHPGYRVVIRGFRLPAWSPHPCSTTEPAMPAGHRCCSIDRDNQDVM